MSYRPTGTLLAATLLLALGGGAGACGSKSATTSPGDGGNGNLGGGGAGGATTTSTTSATGGDPAESDDDGDGFSEAQGDCNDANSNVFPGAPEICDDGVDNNCNGVADASEPDHDKDGFGPCGGDCNDDDNTIHPMATELPDDNIDNNCDGIVDADFDGDGYAVADGDCNDQDPDIHPGAGETCLDGIDNDCNGFIDAEEPDADADGAGPCSGDCNDKDPSIGPNQPEIDGDGIDNNCDNLVDQDIDGDGWTVANGDCDDQNPAVNPAVLEVCKDNIDNDCDSVVDDDCLTKCQLADLFRSSVGCVYYAVDANNDPVEGYDSQPYAVVVSNVDPTDTAKVDVQVRSGNNWNVVASATVAPGTLKEFNLPDRHINYTGLKTEGAYRVVSDVPLIAYQFQPINGQSSYTSDASLLLPTSALDQYYYVVGWGTGFGKPQMIIVGAEDGTSVTITPSVATEGGGGIQALPANQAYKFPMTLNAGDFIQLQGPNSVQAGFTGTYVTADKPIAVFSTHWCANIPTMGCCCDHLEEQTYGLQTWGKKYVASRLPVRNSGTPEATQWHVFASENGTTVKYSAHPQVTGLPAGPQTMNKGQVVFLQVSGSTSNPGDFIVTADKPIFVMEYLSSSFATNAPTQKAGDPAMTQSIPVEQFLKSYVVLVPAQWVYDYLVITKKVGATVKLDGNPVAQPSFVTINDGVNPPEWEVARLAAADGVHKLEGDQGFGVIVVGYDSYDSYAYPGGLDQKVINPIN